MERQQTLECAPLSTVRRCAALSPRQGHWNFYQRR